MIKLTINPADNKITGYCKVLSNTIIYKEDVIVNAQELPNLFSGNYFYENGKIIQKEATQKIATVTPDVDLQKSNSDYLFEQIMNGKTLEEARKLVTERQAQIKQFEIDRDNKRKQYEQAIKNAYLEENRQKDTLLNCKYYTAIVLIIKDENRYLKEWLDYHFSIGVKHIYIYDNGEKENVLDITKDYQNITVIDWRGQHEQLQEEAYNHFLSNYKQDVRWGLFIDSDEFFKITKHGITDINVLLKDYEDYAELWGTSVEYGANGQEKYIDKPVRERFPIPSTAKPIGYYKNPMQVNRIDRIYRHYAYYNPDRHERLKNEQDNKDIFVIDHYYTKSWEEWQWKIKERGSSDPNYRKHLKEFFYYNPDMKHLDTGEDVSQEYQNVK